MILPRAVLLLVVLFMLERPTSVHSLPFLRLPLLGHRWVVRLSLLGAHSPQLRLIGWWPPLVRWRLVLDPSHNHAAPPPKHTTPPQKHAEPQKNHAETPPDSLEPITPPPKAIIQETAPSHEEPHPDISGKDRIHEPEHTELLHIAVHSGTVPDFEQ